MPEDTNRASSSVEDTIAAIEERYKSALEEEKAAHEQTRAALAAANKLLRDSMNNASTVNDVDQISEAIKKYLH